jgi:DHA1 family multidrug resistance protein-like MFS transporter
VSSTLRAFRDPEFLSLSGTAFARAQAYSTIAIALALYADQFGTTSTVEGLFGTVFALTQLLIVLPLGRYIDTHNAKRVLLVGFLVNLAVFVGFALVETVSHVILVRMIQGVGASLLWITGSTVVGDIAPDGERGLWFGTYNQVGAFSSLAGDIVGGALLAVYGFTETYAVLSAITLGAFLAVAVVLRTNPGGRSTDDRSGRETFRDLLGRRTLQALTAFRLGTGFGKMGVLLFLPIYARTGFGMNALVVGIVLAGGKLTKALTQGYVGELTDRVGGKSRFIVTGALLYTAGTLAIPLAEFADGLVPSLAVSLVGRSLTFPPAFAVLFGAFALCGVADSIRLPASMSLFIEEGEAVDATAGSMSLRSVSWKIGQVVGPLTMGVVWDAFGVFAAFGVAAGCILLSTATFIGLSFSRPATA